jgi:hypothetical protein
MDEKGDSVSMSEGQLRTVQTWLLWTGRLFRPGADAAGPR